MKLRRITAFIMAALISCSMTTACSSGGETSSGGTESGSSEASGAEAGASMAEQAAAHFDEDGNLITPIVEEPVTYTMIYRKPNLDVGTMEDKNPVFFDPASELGINFEVQAVESASWTEQVNILFASDELPDLFWGSINNLVNYVEQVTDITDYVQYYAPTVWEFYNNPENDSLYYRAESIGGRLYSVSGVRQNPNEAHVFVMGMNREWLDAVGKEVPTTLDEFTDVIRAFVNEDPNGNGEADEIGIGFWPEYCSGSQNASTLDFFRVFFGLINDGQNYTTDDIMVEDGQIIYCPQDERYRDMLEWLHMMYAEGLLDRDGFTQSEADFKQKGNDNRYGFAYGGCYITDSVGVANGPAFDYFVPVPDAEGEIIIPITQAPADCIRHVYTITNKCENPENLIMLLEYFDSSEDRMSDLWYGKQGELEIDEATGRQAQDSIVGWWWTDDNGVQRRESNQNYYPTEGYQNYSSWRQSHVLDHAPFILSTAWDENRILSDSIEYQYARDEIYTPYYYDEMFPYGEMSYEMTARRAELRVELFNYVETFFAESVINGIDDAKWEDHLNTLQQLNVEEFISGYQEEYEYLTSLE